jgi:signal transduction histidine kinase
MLRFFELNSIKNRMISGFLFLTLLILVLAVVSILTINHITRIAHMNSNINQLEIYTLSLMKSDNDFFDLETINDNYFKTGKSDFLKRRDSLNVLISSEIKGLVEDERKRNYGIEKSLIGIDTTLFRYNVKFKKLEALILKEGFKDYGIEGAMRFHAHALEELIANKDLLSLLYLRRHEKDFLLRMDTSYVSAFKSRKEKLAGELQRQPIKNADIIYHLNEYQRLFSELVSIQLELGLSSEDGLRSELNNLTYILSSQYYSLAQYSSAYSEKVYDVNRIFYMTRFAGAILFSIFSGFWISKRLSEPIAGLSRIIREAITTKQVIRADLSFKNAAIEIVTLGESFNSLMKQIKKQVSRVKKKSKLLKQKNKELEKINHELDNFLYSTAHDLRSPLTSMLGLLHIARIENKQDDLIPYFSLMEASIQRSETFISQIVSFSKNKKMEVVPELLNLRKLVEGIFESHEFMDGSVRINKQTSIHDHVPFYSDQNRIIIIFTNLISNAIKYSDPEKEDSFIRISITISPMEAQIEFADNGQGIDENHMEHIFDMFYRANSDSKGSGLGLFIFKETLTRLGGTAAVESIIGAGTKFFIRIPNLTEQMMMQQKINFELKPV